MQLLVAATAALWARCCGQLLCQGSVPPRAHCTPLLPWVCLEAEHPQRVGMQVRFHCQLPAHPPCDPSLSPHCSPWRLSTPKAWASPSSPSCRPGAPRRSQRWGTRGMLSWGQPRVLLGLELWHAELRADDSATSLERLHVEFWAAKCAHECCAVQPCGPFCMHAACLQPTHTVVLCAQCAPAPPPATQAACPAPCNCASTPLSLSALSAGRAGVRGAALHP